MKTIPLLLTATVNPRGMVGANFSVEERAAMYADTLRFYLSLHLPVVFAENSGSIDLVKQLVGPSDGIEWIDVSGEEYRQERGKGFNETLLIHKAISASVLVAQSGCFFKITGRLKILNIVRLLSECASYSDLQFLADCKDHNVYQWLHLPINGHAGECRYWFASVSFFEDIMFPKLGLLNDYGKSMFLAEDAMLLVCRETRRTKGCRDRFRTQARISGKGGHDLGKGIGFFYSTDNDSFALRLKCALRQLLRYILPFWRC